MLRSDFNRHLVLEKWRSSRSEGRVSLWDDSLGFEIFHEFVVRVIQVKLELYQWVDTMKTPPSMSSSQINEGGFS